MKIPLEVRCLCCREVFCCADCRRNHEKNAHNLEYDCSICRQESLQIRSDGSSAELIKHLVDIHSPLHCVKCQQYFNTIEDYYSKTPCVSNMESISLAHENTVMDSMDENDLPLVLPTPPSSLSETQMDSPTTSHDSVNCSLDHFLSSMGSTVTDHSKLNGSELQKVVYATPYPRMKAHSKIKVSVAPRTLSDCLDEEEKSEKELVGTITSSECKDKTTEVTPKSENIDTPAPMHATSTPTHPSSVPQWNMFQNTCSDSPLSEIDSPGTDVASPPVSVSDLKEYPSADKSSPSKAKRIKSIIARSRRNFEGQDSTERCVTFSNSVTVQADGEISIEKLKAEHEDDGSPRGLISRKPVRRVVRRPRIQTPGPLKPKRTNNPRFQALLNHFQYSKFKSYTQDIASADTPAGCASIPARALLFHQHDSPSNDNPEITSPLPEIKDSIINNENSCKNILINGQGESPLIDGDIFKSCIDDSPVISSDSGAITIATRSEEDLQVLSRNIACCIKRSIDSAMEIDEGQAELQIKVTFTKKKFVTCSEINPEMSTVTNTQTTTIWSSIARAVRGAIWGAVDGTKPTAPTRKIIKDKLEVITESDSATKRKLIELPEPVQSPLNHKKFRYEGRIKGRRPLDRMLRESAATLERSNSAGGADLVKRIDQNFKNKNTDILNHSF